MNIVISGMYGFGDCLHQRAIVLDLLNGGHQVILETYYYTMYEDLVERGLALRLAGGIPPRIRDRQQSKLAPMAQRRNGLRLPEGRHVRLSYNGPKVLQYGSILAAQYASVGIRMPDRPDFSLRVRDEWRDEVRLMLPSSCKPLMVYRPSVLNDLWLSEARSPDPRTYAQLYEFIRDEYLTVSVANLGDKGERIDGPEMDADVKLHRGELDFETMSGLFAEASVTFTCPGFAPVLSQAVGTPTVIVYGGNESFRTTNSVGAHLAPTLAIEPVRPCECHKKDHDCDKTTNVGAAMQKIYEFTRPMVAAAKVPA